MALVSVVTPVYNGERYLAECIESVLAQSFADWEYVILDNCSSDRSGCIAESYALTDQRIRVYHNDEVLPLVANFNRATTLVSPGARYLKFLCADDLLLPHCLKMMVDLAEANPKVVLVGSYKIWGRDAECEGPPFPQDVVCGREICRWFFQGRLGLLGSQTNHLIRLLRPIDGSNLFDERFVHTDIELWVRMLKDGDQFGFVHQVLTFTRLHEETVSEYSHLMGIGRLEYLAILTKYGASFLSERERRALLRDYRRRQTRFLVRALAKVWDRRPWRCQVARSQELGIHFGVHEMIQAFLLEACASILSPADAVRRVRRAYCRARNVGTPAL